MRDYFKHLLQNLDKLSGHKQYEKLCQAPNPKEEITTLLDILTRVCDQFPFIPDESKKQIIQEAVISDPEFIGLNAKFIAKSLNSKKEFYINQKDDVVIHPDALTGEAREVWLKKWMEAINGLPMLDNKVDRFDHIRQIQPKDGELYTPKPQNEYEYRRHLDYIQDNFDPKTGEKLPTWIPEEAYNKVYDEAMSDTKEDAI